jgi:hypothetical protein
MQKLNKNAVAPWPHLTIWPLNHLTIVDLDACLLQDIPSDPQQILLFQLIQNAEFINIIFYSFFGGKCHHKVEG